MDGILLRTTLLAALLAAGVACADVPDHVGPAVDAAFRSDDARVEEARAAIARLDVGRYEIDLCVDPGARSLAAVATLDLSVRGGRVELVLDEALRVLSVDRDGGPRLAYTRSGDGLTIALSDTAAVDGLRLVIRYAGTLAPGDGVGACEGLLILTEPTWWYPSSGPADHATYRVVARYPEGLSSVCTGSLMGMAPLRASPTDRCAAGDVWETSAPIRRADLIVGDLRARRGLWGDRVLDYSWVADPGAPGGAASRSPTAELKEPVRYLEACFGPYPFDWLHVVAVPWRTEGRVTSGPGLVVVRVRRDAPRPAAVPPPDRWLSGLARSWWPSVVDPGPLVTAALGGMIELGWLEITGETELAERRRELLSTQYLAALADSGGRAPLAECLGTDELPDARLCAAKGTIVFSLLRDVLGDEAFCSGLVLLRERSEGGSAALRDLAAGLEASSGSDLDWFFYEWISRGDLPTYILAYEVEPQGGGRFAIIGSIRQEGEVFRTPVPLTIDLAGWSYEEWIQIGSSEQAFEIVTDVEPYGVTVDAGRKVPRIDFKARALLHYERGRAAVASNEWGAAVDEFGAAATFEPDRPEHLYAYGEALVRSGRAADGLAVLERAIEAKPDEASWRLWVAGVHTAAGDLEAALGHLDAYVALRPHDPVGPAERAMVLVEAGDVEGARAAVERAESVADTGASGGGIPDRVWIARGRIEEVAGDTAAAIAAYESALRANPVSDEARVRLSDLRGETHRETGAVHDTREHPAHH